MKIEGLVYIYKLTNPTGQVYIGQSVDWTVRFKSYKNNKAKQQVFLHRSLVNFSWENHNKEIIELCPTEMANDREIYWISFYKAHYKNGSNGLNATLGGGNMPKKRYKGHSQETKDKISVSGKNRNWKREKWHSDRIRQATIIPILQYDLYGKFVEEYESIAEASLKTGLKRSSIGQAADKNYAQKKAGKFLWRYKEDNLIPLKIEVPEIIRRKFEMGVYEIKTTNLITGEVKIYKDINTCSSEIGMHYSQIYRLLKKNQPSKSLNLKFEVIKTENSIS